MVFFLSDILILLFLDYFYPLGKKEKLIRILVFPFIFYLFSKSTFYLSKEHLSLVYLYSLIMITSFSFVKLNLLNSTFFMILLIAPINCLFGIDIMWGASFSPFILKNKLSLSSTLVVALLLVFYWPLDWRMKRSKLAV